MVQLKPTPGGALAADGQLCIYHHTGGYELPVIADFPLFAALQQQQWPEGTRFALSGLHFATVENGHVIAA